MLDTLNLQMKQRDDEAQREKEDGIKQARPAARDIFVCPLNQFDSFPVMRCVYVGLGSQNFMGVPEN